MDDNIFFAGVDEPPAFDIDQGPHSPDPDDLPAFRIRYGHLPGEEKVHRFTGTAQERDLLIVFRQPADLDGLGIDDPQKAAVQGHCTAHAQLFRVSNAAFLKQAHQDGKPQPAETVDMFRFQP